MKILKAVPDRELLEWAEGHPWHGRRCWPAWVTVVDDDGRTQLTWRPDFPKAWPAAERKAAEKRRGEGKG